MNLSEMITLVRHDVNDEATPYQWSDEELTRHINHAVKARNTGPGVMSG